MVTLPAIYFLAESKFPREYDIVHGNLHGAFWEDVMYGSDSAWAEEHGAPPSKLLRDNSQRPGVSPVSITQLKSLPSSL